MASTTDDWLQARHNKWNTPPGLINEYVRKATGAAIAQANRVIAGLDNEVYDVTSNRDHQFIVRISHKAHQRFEGERRALDAARKAGVPTPHVLLIEQAAYDDTMVTFCIEEKLPGAPLDVLLQDGPNSDVNKAIDQIGEMLSKLHSVKVDGFGYLQPDGKGEQASFAEVMLMANERQAELYEAAKKWNIPTTNITTGLELLRKHHELYQFTAPVLVHGDLGQKHILVAGDHISGIIDMQDCSGNHPAIDFVMWDAYWSERIPTGRLVASYGNKSLFGGNYDTLFHLVLLRESFIMLMVHAVRENSNGIQDFIAGMKRALSFFCQCQLNATPITQIVVFEDAAAIKQRKPSGG
jgi:aminoglycoside phosphotransferase (APT) family kinase protein